MRQTQGWTCRKCSGPVAGPYAPCSNCGESPQRVVATETAPEKEDLPMPKLFEEPLHRFHVAVSENDHLWLREEVGERMISDLFRKIIRKLRGKKVQNPELSVVEILEREDLKGEMSP